MAHVDLHLIVQEWEPSDGSTVAHSQDNIVANSRIIATELPITSHEYFIRLSRERLESTEKTDLNLGRVLTATTSSLAGVAVGLKAGLAIGSLFGPVGMAIGPVVGAFYCQWRFLHRTLDTEHPFLQAAVDSARVATMAAADHRFQSHD